MADGDRPRLAGLPCAGGGHTASPAAWEVAGRPYCAWPSGTAGLLEKPQSPEPREEEEGEEGAAGRGSFSPAPLWGPPAPPRSLTGTDALFPNLKGAGNKLGQAQRPPAPVLLGDVVAEFGIRRPWTDLSGSPDPAASRCRGGRGLDGGAPVSHERLITQRGLVTHGDSVWRDIQGRETVEKWTEVTPARF